MLVLSMSILISCSTLASTPVPLATNTITPIPTETPAPTTTSSPTPRPSSTATSTATPTETVAPSTVSVQNREQFEEWVEAEKVKCQGSEEGGQSALMRLFDEAVAVGIIEKGQLALGSGVPSTENPTQCLFLMAFNEGNSVIIYEDSETGEYVQLPVVE